MERLTIPDVRVDEHTTRMTVIDARAVKKSPMDFYWRLKAYEDTGLTPEEINDLASVREISPEAEYAINKHADSIIERLDKLLTQTDDDARLRELAAADKAGRLVVLPCKVGDTLYRVFAGEIFEHRVGSMKYFAIQGRWDIETYPFCSYVESSIGKTIFLTREEAEKALEAKKDE